MARVGKQEQDREQFGTVQLLIIIQMVRPDKQCFSGHAATARDSFSQHLRRVYDVPTGSSQIRACPKIGSTQHLACWPSAAQIDSKSSAEVGVDGATVIVSSCSVLKGSKSNTHG